MYRGFFMYRGTPSLSSKAFVNIYLCQNSTWIEQKKTFFSKKEPKEKKTKQTKKTMSDSTDNKMPSRPPTAYLLYQSDQDLSGKWQKLNAKQHTKYANLHAEDKTRYEEEMEGWRESGGKDQHEVPKPKQPLTPYMFFSKEQNVGAKWRAEPEDVKDDYKATAKELLEEYKVSMAAYQEKFGPRVLEAPDWPARPLAPYMRFAQESRPDFKARFPDHTTAQIGRKLGAGWREMSDDDKQLFIDAYEQENEEWVQAIADYEAEWGDIAFIKKARKKEDARLKAEQTKAKAAAKREKEREKNKAKREREKAKAKREREKAAAKREKERLKKQKEKEQEKALRQGLSLYKRENRPRFKKRDEFVDASASEVNDAIEEQWEGLSQTTRKSWARRAVREMEERKSTSTAAGKGKGKKGKGTAKAGQKRSRSVSSSAPAKKTKKAPVKKNAAKKKTAAAKKKTAATAKKETGISAADLRKGLKIYTDDWRPKLKKKNPDAKTAEITKLIKEKWNKLSDKTHAKYVKQALEPVVEEEVEEDVPSESIEEVAV